MKTARIAAVEFRQMQSTESTGSNDDETAESGKASSTLVAKNGRMVRRRSLSLAEPQPSVETVIVKAKRAAQSLWMLLHAQSCVLAQKCPHTGCQEAKLLHLHLKTCQAGPNGECPMLYHGCDQSRKLLAHYRRCRTLRARQNTSSSSSSSSSSGGNIGTATTSASSSSVNGAAASLRLQQQRGATANAAVVNGSHTSTTHHCLVCSLMARQARTVLERTKLTTSSSYANPITTNGLAVAASSIRPTHYMKKGNSMSSNSSRKVSYVLSTVEAESLSSSPRRSNSGKTASGGGAGGSGNFSMPPPPRRRHSNADELVSATAGASTSLDSLARLYATAKHLELDEADEDMIPAPRRGRAASDAEVLLLVHQQQQGQQHALMLLGEVSALGDTNENNLNRRERSASCGTAPTTMTTSLQPSRSRSSSSRNRLSPLMSCDTILEDEPLANMGTTIQGWADELAMDQGV